MPDTRSHRGAHPEDAALFSPAQWEKLRVAVRDFSLLLTMGYPEKGALKLVGDRYSLTGRQRLAVQRCSCSDSQLFSRLQRRVTTLEKGSRPLIIDGYNVLITIEAALGSGIILCGRDGVYRDIASIHGTYRKVEETLPAIDLIGSFLMERNGVETEWLLDSPVSNSGRLRGLIEGLAAERGWQWQVKLVPNVDAILSRAEAVIASGDSIVLDRCKSWTNLVRSIVDEKIPDARIVDLSGGEKM